MVNFIALLASAALLSSRVMAAPIPDSAINEPGVRSPDGTPITDGTPAPTDKPSANYGNGGNNYGSPASSSPMMDQMTTTMMMGDTTTVMMKESTTTMMQESTTTMMKESTSTMMMESTSTMMAESTSTTMMEDTTTAAPSTTTSTMYGSGYNNWNSGYDSCVQQCMNTYGAPPAMYTAPPSTTTATDSGSGGGGSGSTLTVIVAPAQGILRFVPFAINATAGDTIHFEWNGSPHTVTRSSTVLPCNKTADPTGFFASGVQNKSFTFDITVNDTNTIAYYCGVPGHCPKGMFAFINPPNAAAAPTTVATMMPALIANNSELAMQAMYVANKTMGTSAYTWGDHMDMSDVPPELHVAMIQNVFQTRLMFAANEGMLESNQGAVNPNGGAVTIPADITQITAADPAGANASPSSTGAPAGVAETASSSSSTATSTGTPSGSSKTGGAMGKSVASSAAIGIAVLAAFLVL